MTLANWRRLRGGTATGVVLAVDFGPRTGQRGFVRLAENLGIDESVYETVPPKPGPDLRSATLPDRYIGHWMAAIAETRPPVCGVLTFCAGSRFAGALVGALTDLGLGKPPVVLIDPSSVYNESLWAEFDAGIASLGAHLSEPELEAARAAVRGQDGDLVAVAEALCTEQRSLVERAFDRAGIDSRLVDGMSGRFATYLGYLVAAGRAADYDTSVTQEMVVVSEDHRAPKPHDLRLGVLHDELLGSLELAHLLRDEVLAMQGELT